MMQRAVMAVLALLWLAFAAARPAPAEELFALTALTASGGQIVQTLLSFDSAMPGTLSRALTLTGLPANDDILGIDFRPDSGQLYGLSFRRNLYTINTQTGAAALVGPLLGPGLTTITNVGLDFNPAEDYLRVTPLPAEPVFSARNLRVNADTGETATEGALRYAPGDPNSGRSPFVAGLAYTNNAPGASSTTLFGIDASAGVLVRQEPQSEGVLSTVGPLGLDASLSVGLTAFDISGATGTAYAVLTPGGPQLQSSRLYTINLGTGAATLVGTIGGGATLTRITGLSAAPIPEPGTLLLLGTGLAGAGMAAVRRRRKEGASQEA